MQLAELLIHTKQFLLNFKYDENNQKVFGEPFLTELLSVSNFIAIDEVSKYPSANKPFYEPFRIGGLTTQKVFDFIWNSDLSRKYWVVGQDFQTLERLGGIRTESTTLAGIDQIKNRKFDPEFTFNRIAKGTTRSPAFEKVSEMEVHKLGEYAYKISKGINVVNYKLGEIGERLVYIFIEDPCPCQKTLYMDVALALMTMPQEIKDSVSKRTTEVIST